MAKSSRSHGALPPSIGLLIITLICSVPAAGGDWQRLYCDAPALSIEAPPGWSLRPVDVRGARVVGPARGPVIEIVVWDALHLPATPETAIAEHEAVLGRSLDYRRDTVTEIVTLDDRRGLVVEGRVRARGVTEASLFAAFADDSRHVIVGVFASPGEIERLRESLLERMIRTFRLELQIAPLPAPELPPVPGERQPGQLEPPDPDPALPPAMEAGRAPMTIGVGPDEEPIGPDAPAAEMPWIEHLNPRGFTLSIPVDWLVTIEEGTIVSTPAEPDAERAALLITPVVGPDAGAERMLRHVTTVLPDIRLTRIISVEGDSGTAVVDASAAGGMRLRATWTHEDRSGLLIVAVALRTAWETQFPTMARIAASFEAARWPLPQVPSPELTGAAGGMAFKLPDGWEVSGGVGEDGGEMVINLEAAEPVEGGIRVAWQQPLRPRLRDLTPLLQSLGWREGERYSVPEGGTGLLIFRRRTPVEAVKDILLPRHPRELGRVALEVLSSDASAAALLPGAEPAGQVVLVRADGPDGRRELLYVTATARAEAPLAATCWETAFLQADAPEGRLAEAVAVLAEIAGSAVPSGDLHGHRCERLSRTIDRARRSLSAVPQELLPDWDAGWFSVLTLASGHEDVGDGVWEAPRGALDAWTGPASAMGER